MNIIAKSAVRLSILLAACSANVGLLPAQESADAEVARLIEKLGDDDYFTREQAQKELEKIGFEAFDALSAAVFHDDLEVVSRARYLLQLIQERLTREDDPAQVKQLLSGYQFKNAPQRISVMQSLSRLPDNQGVPILCRLVRFEKSPMLSKQAAVAIFSDRGPEKKADEKLKKLVRENVASSKRKPADWLRAWLEFSDKPEPALEAWIKLVDEERALFSRSPKETSSAVSAAMLRLQIAWLEKLDRQDEAVAAMRSLFELDWAKSDDPPQVKALLASYNRKNTNSRLAVIKALAKLPKDEGAAALCRLARFEKSPLMAKTAAVALFDGRGPDNLPDKKLTDLVKRSFTDGKREPSQWLSAWLKFPEDTEATADRWAKMVDEESATLKKHANPPQSSTEIVTAMLRMQTAWLEKLGRKDDAVVALSRLVKLEEKGNPQTLQKLLEYLIQKKAWDTIEDLAKRFPSRFSGSADLLYLLAEAQASAGKQQAADTIAEKALKLNPGTYSAQLRLHLLRAYTLRDRGRFDWAKSEYQHVADKAPTVSSERIGAMSGLAEMLHDQADDLGAAKALVPAVAAMKKGQALRLGQAMLNPDEIKARMNYFFACDWKTKGDAAKHREYLDKALAAYPGEIDVLIALYKIPNQSKAQLAKTREAIKKTAAELRTRAKASPHDPAAHNQYAWLVGNTEGDFDEALEFSKRSIALRPDSGGYHDTLAHVYFGKGDYENAVKTQEKAAELEPHSGLLQRKLKLFREKLAEKKKQSEEEQPEEEEPSEDKKQEATEQPAEEKSDDGQ